MDYPSVRTCILGTKRLACTNVSCDSAGRVLLSYKLHGAVLATQSGGGGIQRLDLTPVVQNTSAFVSATIGNAGARSAADER